MKRTLIVLFAVLSSAAAQATLSPVTGDYTCRRISNDSLRLDCLSVISGRHVNQIGAAACNRMSSAITTLSCMRAIAGHTMQEDAVNACDRITNAELTIPCLNAIADKSYSNREVQDCDSMSTAEGTTECFRRFGRSDRFERRDDRVGRIEFPRRDDRDGTPSVRSDLCYVRQTNQWVNGEQFFSLVHEFAVKNNRCAVAKIATVEASGRIYDRDGSRVEKGRGGLSNREVEQTLRNNNMFGCEVFSCTQAN